MQYKIAIVEDNELIRNMVKINLRKEEYQVYDFGDGESFLERVRYEIYDLVILDFMLPGITGMGILERLREWDVDLPVLMLTVRGEVEHKINALNLGADDYLVKPFNMEELLARVQALIRRSHGKRSLPANRVLTIGGHQINLDTHRCGSNSGEVTLSEKEVRLLSYFSANAGQTLRRADILEEVWGMDVSPTPRTVDNFVLKFRKLFEENPETPRHFISVRNKGYRFER